MKFQTRSNFAGKSDKLTSSDPTGPVSGSSPQLPSSELLVASSLRYLIGPGGAHPASSGWGANVRNIKKPQSPITTPGTMKLRLQSDSTNSAAIRVPSIFPKDVCEFQTPKINPRFPLPNQLPTTVTTPGQPVVWNIPPIAYKSLNNKFHIFTIFWIRIPINFGE